MMFLVLGAVIGAQISFMAYLGILAREILRFDDYAPVVLVTLLTFFGAELFLCYLLDRILIGVLS
jgi:hypothetical protein